MSRSLKLLWTAAGVWLATGSLTGCSSTNTEDLEIYTQEVKSRQHASIEPLPEFAPYETYLYQSVSLRDPFSPPVARSAPRSEGRNALVSNGLTPDFDRNREPLEFEPLDTLRMVGTLERKGGSWALIQMSDTTIHRVTTGNYVGQNHGKIVAINESEVEVTEIVPDGLGGWIERQAALALSE